MSENPPTPPVSPAGQTPPLPPRVHDAPAAPAAPHAAPAFTPPPGLPATAAEAKGLFRSLFDLKFDNFVTHKVAGVLYLVGLVLIGLFAIGWFLTWVVTGFAAMQYQAGTGILLILGALIIVPIATFIEVLVFRITVEVFISVVIIAENTRSLRR